MGMYIANHYISFNGRLLRKGDYLPADFPADKIEKLLRAGAISASAPIAEPAETAPEQNTELTIEEPPVDIDVMSGVVEAPKKRPAKKTAERRKTK